MKRTETRGRKPSFFPPEGELRAMHSAGATLAEMAAHYGKVSKTVRAALGRIGIRVPVKKMRPRGVTPPYAIQVYAPLRGKRIVSRLFRSWQRLHYVCSTKHALYFHFYGSRGIRVCAQWRSYRAFRDWSLAHGFRKGLTLRRNDPDGDFSPSNCSWGAWAERVHTSRSVKVLEHEGVRLPLPLWAPRVGIAIETLRSRLNDGFTVEQALKTPLRQIRIGYTPKPRGRAAYTPEQRAAAAAHREALKQGGASAEIYGHRLRANALYATALTALPAWLDPDSRNDVAGDIVVAVLEGRLAVHEITAKAKEFVRLNSSMFRDRRLVSIDTPVYAGCIQTIGDRLAAATITEEYIV